MNAQTPSTRDDLLAIASGVCGLAVRLAESDAVDAYLDSLPAEQSVAMLLGMAIAIEAVRRGRVETLAKQLMGVPR